MGLTLILCCPPAVVKMLMLFPELIVDPAAVEVAMFWTALMGMAMICRTPVCGFVCTAFCKET